MKITKTFDISKNQRISIPLWVSDDKKEWVQRNIVCIKPNLGYLYETDKGGWFKYASVEKPKETYLTKDEAITWLENHKFGYAIRYSSDSGLLISEWDSPTILLYTNNSIKKLEWCRVAMDESDTPVFGIPHKFTKEEMQ